MCTSQKRSLIQSSVTMVSNGNATVYTGTKRGYFAFVIDEKPSRKRTCRRDIFKFGLQFDVKITFSKSGFQIISRYGSVNIPTLSEYQSWVSSEHVKLFRNYGCEFPCFCAWKFQLKKQRSLAYLAFSLPNPRPNASCPFDYPGLEFTTMPLNVGRIQIAKKPTILPNPKIRTRAPKHYGDSCRNRRRSTINSRNDNRNRRTLTIEDSKDWKNRRLR